MLEFGDIEGTWTFIYFSYSRSEKKVVAWMQLGSEAPKSATNSVVHPEISYLKFKLAGKEFNYSSFNGQFTKLALRVGKGAYIGDMAGLKKYMDDLGPQPTGVLDRLVTIEQIKEPVETKDK